MRLKSIKDSINTCRECDFTALFFYLDAAGCPLCPKCAASEIQAFKDSLESLDDDLESEIELYNEELEELNF